MNSRKASLAMKFGYAVLIAAAWVPLIAAAAAKNGFVLDGALVPVQEIKRGGPRKDGIPALTNPLFVKARNAGFIRNADRVLGISYNGVTRAYPIRILNYHELVNDELNGRAIVVSYCPLCGSGMAFASTLHGEELVFGVSGLLYNSDVLMYDRQTNSLWSQIMSQAITGSMRGNTLETIPISHTTWSDWKLRYPDTEVLSTKTGFRRKYYIDPYPNYSKSGKIFFPVNNSSSRYSRKTVVMGLEINGEFRVYPFDELEKLPHRFTDNFQGMQLDVQFDSKNQTARILGEDNSEIPTIMAFWFAWYAFHPDADVFTAADFNE